MHSRQPVEAKNDSRLTTEWQGKKPSPQPEKTLQSNRPTVLPLNTRLPLIIIFACIGFIPFRNTVIWHLLRFWTACGDFCQAGWDRIVDFAGENPMTFLIYGTLIWSSSIYWVLGTIYTFMDLTKKPAPLQRYKIQSNTEPLETKQIIKVICSVLLNQSVVSLPVAYMYYSLMMWRGIPPLRELPSLHWLLVELVLFIIVEEITFYYSHRLLHWRYFYKYIHKRHHEWTPPMAITAIYCHPVEHVLSNLIPIILGVIIAGSHIATTYLWFTIAIMSTINAHSGYHLPFLASPEFHDFHHVKFNQCFGVIGVLDRLHGTDKIFRYSRNYARHKTMTTLVPARELYPDEPKRKQ